MRHRSTQVLGVSALLLACAGEPTGTPPGSAPVASIVITPALDTLAPGATVQLAAEVRDTSGTVVTDRELTWVSLSPSVAGVSDSGLVTGVTDGSAKINATAEGVTGDADITVETPVITAPVGSVVIAPAVDTVAPGANVQLSVEVRDTNGTVVTNRTVTWASLAPSIASVSGSGLVTGVSDGTATITATAESVTGNAGVTVETPIANPGVIDTLLVEGFESGSVTWDDEGQPSRHAIVTDAMSAHSGSKYLAVTFPQGSDGGWMTKFFMPGYDTLYISYWVWLEPGWDHGQFATKLLNIGGARIDNQWSQVGNAGVCPNGTDFFTAILAVFANGLVNFNTIYVDEPPDNQGNCWGLTGDGTEVMDPARQFTTGAWHRVEYLLILNDPTASNFSQQFWLDGVLKGTWSGIRVRTTTDLRLNVFTISASIAGGSPRTQTMHIDDIVVANGRQ